jgi:uncharacterized membrane protein YfcA
MPDLSLWQWLLGGLCAILAGMAKTGVPGLGILVVPVMFSVVGEHISAPGALLPLLCAADCFAVFYFRRHARAWDLMHLFPWVAGGIAIGTAVLHVVSDDWLRLLVGVIVLVMVSAHLLRKRVPDDRLVGRSQGWRSALLFGVLTGFATTVANAAGPVMNLYLLSMDLPKEQFMGTGAWFFFLVNLVKVPIYIWQGMITPASLLIDLWLLPGLVLGVLLGKRVYDLIPQRLFEYFVLSFTIIAGIRLLFPR